MMWTAKIQESESISGVHVGAKLKTEHDININTCVTVRG